MSAPVIRRIAPQDAQNCPTARETGPARYRDILAALTAIAGGARSPGDVASRCGWSIAQAGAVLLLCERHAYLPTDYDGNWVFMLRPAALLLVEQAVEQERVEQTAQAWQPPSQSVRAWLKQAGSGGTKC